MRDNITFLGQLVRYISLTFLEDYGNNNTLRNIICYLFTVYFGILSITLLLLMFIINTNSRGVMVFIKIYFTSYFLLMFPYLNAVYNLPYGTPIVIFSIFQLLSYLVFLMSLKYIGQEILSHNSV